MEACKKEIENGTTVPQADGKPEKEKKPKRGTYPGSSAGNDSLSWADVPPC